MGVREVKVPLPTHRSPSKTNQSEARGGLGPGLVRLGVAPIVNGAGAEGQGEPFGQGGPGSPHGAESACLKALITASGSRSFSGYVNRGYATGTPPGARRLAPGDPAAKSRLRESYEPCLSRLRPLSWEAAPEEPGGADLGPPLARPLPCDGSSPEFSSRPGLTTRPKRPPLTHPEGC